MDIVYIILIVLTVLLIDSSSLKAGTINKTFGLFLFITVNFFSVLFGADENVNGGNPLRDPETGSPLTIEQYLVK